MDWLPDFIAAVVSLCTAVMSTQYDLRSASQRIRGHENGISSATGSCVKLQGACIRQCGNSTVVPSSRIFWTLQKGIVRSFQSLLRLERNDIHISESLVNPSPLSVFAGWMIVALALSITLEISDGRRHHAIFLSYGILVSTVLGVVECAPLSSVLLTNVPWSVAIGLACCAVYPRRKNVLQYSDDEKDG